MSSPDIRRDQPSFSYRLADAATRALITIPGYNFTVSGYENFLPEDPYVLAYTHHNSDDIRAIGHVIMAHTGRPLHNLAKQELLEKKLIGPVLKSMHGLPIDRDARVTPPSQIINAIRTLKAGHILSIAAEGGRVNGNRVAEIRSGAGYFAIKGNVVIVPVAVVGRNWRVKDTSLWFIPRSMHVHAGQAMDVRGLGRDDLPFINQELQSRLQAALDKSYDQYEVLYGRRAAGRLDRS